MIKYKKDGAEIEFETVEQLNMFVKGVSEPLPTPRIDHAICSSYMFLQNISSSYDNVIYKIGTYLILNAGSEDKVVQFYNNFEFHHKEIKRLISEDSSLSGRALVGDCKGLRL